ncbi:sulfatase-like hydrolase/transferase [Wohlfahrtiimonas populi]|uniref:sulfatase-like hydrolase/transferase n=1 Tax=Wohlfahrtiimonas populi TaxID=1940240 RepID=UPI00098D2794|nr:sulfatase-like hydrolase/transferase [Wohlfahrtiimonas populi]
MKKWCWLWLIATFVDASITIVQTVLASGAKPEIVPFDFSKVLENIPYWLDSIWYVFNIIAINAIFAFLGYFLFKNLKKHWSQLPNISLLAFLYLTFGALMVLAKERFDIIYPSYLYHPFNIESIEESLWMVSVVILGIAALGYLFLNLKYWKSFATLYIILAGLSYYPYIWGTMTSVKEVENLDKPNVIYILLDAVRPDHMKAGGAPFDIMPKLNKMIEEQGVFYKDVTVSVGRSFPSAIAILTGKHAINNGIRDNLFAKQNVNYNETLPNILKENGYQTRLAVDGGQFWGFDEDYGFEELWSSGLANINMIPLELGGFMPLPLLFANTRVGELFFPYLYADRNIDTLYDTSALVHKIENGLNFTDKSKPLFLFMSLDLPHTPYRDETEYSKAIVSNLSGTDYADACKYYLASMNVVEDQLFSVISTLKEYGRMQNTILVVGSDHGQGFVMAKDSYIRYDGEAFPHLEGFYGNSALNPSSTNLMFSIFSSSPLINLEFGIRDLKIESVDITPMLLDILNIEPSYSLDGQSFKENLQDSGYGQSKIRFVEGGFKNKLTFDKGNSEDVALLTSNTLVDLNTLKTSWNKEGELQILLNKDRSVYFDQWSLLTEDFLGNPYVVNHDEKIVWPITLAPSDAPVIKMLQAWCEHYSKDIASLSKFGVDQNTIAQGYCTLTKQDELLSNILHNQPYDRGYYQKLDRKFIKSSQFICTREHLY